MGSTSCPECARVEKQINFDFLALPFGTLFEPTCCSFWCSFLGLLLGALSADVFRARRYFFGSLLVPTGVLGLILEALHNYTKAGFGTALGNSEIGWWL